jgi:hypothetical protein
VRASGKPGQSAAFPTLCFFRQRLLSAQSRGESRLGVAGMSTDALSQRQSRRGRCQPAPTLDKGFDRMLRRVHEINVRLQPLGAVRRKALLVPLILLIPIIAGAEFA